MLLTLDLAHSTGNHSDRKTADRLQRRSGCSCSSLAAIRCGSMPCVMPHDSASLRACRLLHDDLKESGLLPVLARLMKQFVFKHQSKEHAQDLVRALHVVLRMLERLSREGACISA